MAGFDVSGPPVACGNCHGEDGRGRAEGGIEPPSIVWSELTKPYGHQHAGGRRHGPFDERLLRRAVIDGIDPDGNRLDAAMPRYAMSEKDFAALAAYLRKLESILDPGLGAEVIRIGTLLPAPGRMAGLEAALHELLRAYFEALNRQGGIHGRRLELIAERLPEDPGEARAATRALVEGGRVFALIAPFSAGVEEELASAAAAAQVPVVGPLTLYPEDRQTSNQHVFHVLPGVPELARVLVRQAAAEAGLAGQPVALLHADTPGAAAGVRALEAELREAGWRAPLAVPFASDAMPAAALAAELKARGVAAVLLLGAGADLVSLAREGARIGWIPRLLVPGPLAPRDIVALPMAYRDRVTLAYPSAPSDQRPEALAQFERYAQAGGATRAYQPVRIAAYAAGLLLVEGLKRTGRDLSRRKLVARLETLQGFDTGLLPPLSYNADRRIGSMGAYLVGVDLERKALRPLGGFVRLP